MRLHPAHGADELIAPSRGMLVSLYRSTAARMTPVHLRMSWAMLWSKRMHIVAVRSLHRISTISRRATLEGCALDIRLGSWDSACGSCRIYVCTAAHSALCSILIVFVYPVKFCVMLSGFRCEGRALYQVSMQIDADRQLDSSLIILKVCGMLRAFQYV